MRGEAVPHAAQARVHTHAHGQGTRTHMQHSTTHIIVTRHLHAESDVLCA